MANIKSDIVFGILFLTISNADIDFQAQDLQWRFYITGDIFSTAKKIELIWKKEFAITVLDLEYKVFVVYIVALSVDSGDKIYLLRKVQMTDLKANKVHTVIPSKYIDFADIFLPKLAIKLPKYMRINDHTIKLVDNWQSLYGPIYSLGLVELETLKTYIKNNLTNSFIRFSKSSAKTFIFFNKKPDRSLRLYINYQNLNNLTIKNRYFLSLVGKSLNWQNWA